MTNEIVHSSSPISGEIVRWKAPEDKQSRENLVGVIASSIFPTAKREAIYEVLAYCDARGIDPLLKPVHIVPIWDKRSGKMIDTIMPGIYLYRILAGRTGQYAGKTAPEWGNQVTQIIGNKSVTFPEFCRITVKRIICGKICEFTAEEWWVENFSEKGKDFNGKKDGSPNSMWSKRPRGQLAKCAEAQALRMAFPEELGGEMTFDEMEGKTPSFEKEKRVEKITHSLSEEQKKKNALTWADFVRGKIEAFSSFSELEAMQLNQEYKERYERASVYPEAKRIIEDAIQIRLKALEEDFNR